MDIQKLREEFEKLSEIRDSLSKHILFVGDKYTTPSDSFFDLVNWLNGAWYMYKEQQKVIDENNSSNQSCENQLGQACVAWIEKYNEQQKQIDEIKAMAESWINQDYTHNSDSTDIKIQQMKDCGRDIIRKINWGII